MKSLLFLIFLTVLFASGVIVSAQGKNGGAGNAVSTTVVINEVYGGAGCGTAGCSTYQNDFIEIKNISAGNVNITGWSVQYAAATGTSWQVTAMAPTGTVLRPGDTYLIAESFGANGVNPLPTPNFTGTIAMSATGAKVALVNTTVALSGACPASATIVDFVAYGTTPNCVEDPTGTPAGNSTVLAVTPPTTEAAPAPSTTTSVARVAAGTDTDNNNVDFTAGAPTPLAATHPTAAGANLAGRIVTSDGRGISKARVTLVDDIGQVRTFITNGFGYYSFYGLQTGATYTVSVQSKSYQFNPSARAVSVQDNVSDFNFTAEP
jgi:hypothetical protein